MKKKNYLVLLLMITIFTVAVTSCSDDDDMEDVETGQLVIRMTDAPIDDANIEGTFVTISDVKIDGVSVENFEKQTIEISAYQEGETVLLLNEDVEARSYESVSLVFDYESDESGESPGCYVLTDDSQKHNLAAESQTHAEMTFFDDFVVENNSESSWVVDFDLRKAVAREEDSSTDTEYKFVAATGMQNALRIVNEDNSGEIQGEVSGTLTTDETYVYAYRKGEFNASTEIMGQGEDNVFFANAVTSAKVNADGTYTLAFLQEGDYEIHVVSYEKMNAKSMFSAMLNASSLMSGIMLNDVSVTAESTLELDIDILGIL